MNLAPARPFSRVVRDSFCSYSLFCCQVLIYCFCDHFGKGIMDENTEVIV